MKNASFMARAYASSTLLILLTVTGGCAAQEKVAPWTPKLLVQWEDISTHAFPPVRNGYYIFIQQPTTGLFPTSMGVTRMVIDPPVGDPFGYNDPRLAPSARRLLTDPRNEFLQWNQAFDNLMAVSEVFPIRERDMGGGEAEPRQILAAFQAFDAHLGLIYAINELTPMKLEMFGVLYDSRAARPIAALHAQAISTMPPEEQLENEPRDLWKTDARARVRKRFERLLHACLSELIMFDQPDQPRGLKAWTVSGSARPVEWPPRHFSVGP